LHASGEFSGHPPPGICQTHYFKEIGTPEKAKSIAAQLVSAIKTR
jgi:hypothetical protein